MDNLLEGIILRGHNLPLGARGSSLSPQFLTREQVVGAMEEKS